MSIIDKKIDLVREKLFRSMLSVEREKQTIPQKEKHAPI